MKYFIYLLLFIPFSCTKDMNFSQGGNPGGNGNYNFQDLAVNENLVDSVLIFGGLGTPGAYKFYYASKNAISSIFRDDYINTYRGLDTIYYSGKLDSIKIRGENALAPGIFFTQTTKFQYTNSLKVRAFNYEDNYYQPIYRQLGSYISYSTNGHPILINFKYIEGTFAGRDSIRINLRRKSNGNIDSVINSQSVFPGSQNGLVLTFEYGTEINKLANNANLKELRYSYYYHPIQFNFNSIDNYQPNVLDYLFMTDVFFDVLFNSSVLPIKFYYHRGTSTPVPFYLKYEFNTNNYVTNVSIGSSSGFNPITNERVRLSYYKKP